MRLYCDETCSIVLYPWCSELRVVTELQTEIILYQAHYEMYW